MRFRAPVRPISFLEKREEQNRKIQSQSLRLSAALRPSAERCGPPDQPFLARLKPCPDTKRVRARRTLRQWKLTGDRELSRHNTAALRPSAERCGPSDQPFLARLKPCPDTKRVRARWILRQWKLTGDRELSRHNAAVLRPSAERCGPSDRISLARLKRALIQSGFAQGGFFAG